MGIDLGRNEKVLWTGAPRQGFMIIQSGLFTSTIKSLNLRTLSDVTLSERGNGSGTITFGLAYRGSAWGNGLRWPGMPEMPMFDSITSARSVYDTIRDAQRAASGSPA
jgi:hypothetical protein